MFTVIGSVTADILVFREHPFAGGEADGFQSGNLVFTEKPPLISMGGNGGNSAYVMAGLDMPTALCGAVGQDLLGDTLVDWLQARNVNLSGLVRSPILATSSSTILLRGTAGQVVYHHHGSTVEARLDSQAEVMLAQSRGLLASSFSILPQFRNGGFARALEAVHQRGGLTALDIGPAIGKPVTLEEIRPLLPHLDYLLANRHEIQAMMGENGWEKSARGLLKAGARHVIVKKGAGGSTFWSAENRLDVPAYQVKTHIPVGAGDSFNAGFLSAVSKSAPVERAMQFGSAVAALVVSSENGIFGSPGWKDVERFIDKFWK